MLAKNLPAPRSFRKPALSLTFFREQARSYRTRQQIADLERGHRLTSPKGIAPKWD
ncbi:hypothetical protein [Pseudomonas synxantha]|uniref:Methylglyoxal reductase, acetol producing 2,5-diketo-D-gluconic acid reductase B n=1 Tax=Pseudomonas synxantha TaxID=47883 RepID=A0AAU8TU72_9PSED|nr:hypothetical protein [Pseudomonas synxantha]AKA85905.1 Methylglyoxal reductase, acetol producing 2,5-diketo-D-gluconic acid reductase B [Pseudomonas synxantha]